MLPWLGKVWMKLPSDLQTQPEALPLRAVMLIYRRLFGWVWDRLWNEPLPDPEDSAPYTITWQPPLDYDDAQRFYAWRRSGERQWVFEG